MTGYQIVYAALRVLKVVKWAGQQAATEEMADGLTFLNNMLDSWSTQRILVPVVTFAKYALTASVGSYSIGPTGTSPFNVARPIRIDAAGIVQTSYNSGTVIFRAPLRIISEKEYVSIPDKTATGDIPETLYYAPAVPNGTLYLDPIPLCATPTQIEISAWTPLASFPDVLAPPLGTDVSLAPGYARAIVYNLAVELVDAMEGAQLSQADAAHALEAKQYIMELNSEMVPQMPDAAIPPLTSLPFEPVPATLKTEAQAKFGGQQSPPPGS